MRNPSISNCEVPFVASRLSTPKPMTVSARQRESVGRIESRFQTWSHFLLRQATASSPQLFNSSTLQLFNPSTLQLFNSSTLQLFNPSTLQPFNCSTLQLFNSSTLQPFNPSTVQLFNCSTVQLFNCSTISPSVSWRRLARIAASISISTLQQFNGSTIFNGPRADLTVVL